MSKTLEGRLEALERNQDTMRRDLDLVVNYCRAIATTILGAERIREIEKELGNGHDTAVPHESA